MKVFELTAWMLLRFQGIHDTGGLTGDRQTRVGETGVLEWHGHGRALSHALIRNVDA